MVEEGGNQGDRRIANSGPGTGIGNQCNIGKDWQTGCQLKMQVVQECGIAVSHIVCKCSALAQREYKGRHDGLAKAVH